MPATEQSIAALPSEPGVYLFRDGQGEILYIGKARHLRRRVRSYFRTNENPHHKTRAMLQRASRIDVLIVRTEREALLLEAGLIRAHRPRYNRRLKDSRGYPFLEVAHQEPMPRVRLTYDGVDDDAAYFGPVPDVGAMRDALTVIRQLYTVRSAFFEHTARNRTAADHPRIGADHRRMTREVMALLEGRSDSVKRRIEQAMRAAAGAQKFERAARLRSALATVESLPHLPRAPAIATPVALPRVLARITVELSAPVHAGLREPVSTA